MKQRCNFMVDIDLLARVDSEAELQHMNRTQYIIRALSQMCETDMFVRVHPDIKKQMLDLQNTLQSISVK